MAAEVDECGADDRSTHDGPHLIPRRSSSCARRPHPRSRSLGRTAGFAQAAGAFAHVDGDSDGQLDDDDDDDRHPFASSNRPPARPQPPGSKMLRALWRRVLREKRRILNSGNPPPAASRAVPYDPYTYAQNFDEGWAAAEPDNLSRSFSARFAAPPSSGMIQTVG